MTAKKKVRLRDESFIGLRIESATFERLQAAAERFDRPVSWLVRKMITKCLDNPQLLTPEENGTPRQRKAS